MKGLKDQRAVKWMIAQRKSYASIASALKSYEIELTPTQVYRIMTYDEKADKRIKQAIARVLDCAVEDIF